VIGFRIAGEARGPLQNHGDVGPDQLGGTIFHPFWPFRFFAQDGDRLPDGRTFLRLARSGGGPDRRDHAGLPLQKRAADVWGAVGSRTNSWKRS
jgi:hypothetical protein